MVKLSNTLVLVVMNATLHLFINMLCSPVTYIPLLHLTPSILTLSAVICILFAKDASGIVEVLP